MWNPYHLLVFGQIRMKLAQGIGIGCKNHIADGKALMPLMLRRIIPRVQVVHKRTLEAFYPSELRLTRPQQLIPSPEQHHFGELTKPGQQFGLQRPLVRPQFVSLYVLPSIGSHQISHYVVELSAYIRLEGAKFGDDQIHKSPQAAGSEGSTRILSHMPITLSIPNRCTTSGARAARRLRSFSSLMTRSSASANAW